MHVRPGKRREDDEQLREAYLAGGDIPLGLKLRKGIHSLLTDPWKALILGMTGPLGLVLRGRHFRRKLGHLGRNAVIGRHVDIRGERNVYVGDLTFLDDYLKLEAPEGYIRIGKRCHIAGWVLGHEGVEIGDYVASGGMILSITDSHQGGFRMSGPMIPREQRRLRRGRVVIGRDAFIGQFSVVLPGTTIGEGAVVGPHSLVAGKIKPWTVVMGSPATVIGHRDEVKFDDPDTPA